MFAKNNLQKGLNESPFLIIQPHSYALSSAMSQEKTKIEQGRDTLARRRIPIVGLVPSFIFFALPPPPGTQWIVERLIVYCMIIDILPEILLIDIYKLYRYR